MKRLEEGGFIHISQDRHGGRSALCISEAVGILAERHSAVVDRCSATALERLQCVKRAIARGRSSAHISFEHAVNISEYRVDSVYGRIETSVLLVRKRLICLKSFAFLPSGIEKSTGNG